MPWQDEPVTVRVVIPPPELDADSAPEFAGRVQAALEQFPDLLVVDLTDATFVGVTAIDILIDAKTVLDNSGGRMQIRGAPPPVRRMLALSPAFQNPDVADEPQTPPVNPPDLGRR